MRWSNGDKSAMTVDNTRWADTDADWDLFVFMFNNREPILSALRVAEAEDSVAKFAEYAWLRWEMESSLNNHQETCEVCAARSAWERENFDYLTREDVEEDEHPKTPEVSGCSVFAGLLKDHMWLTEQFKSALKDWQDKTDPHRALQPTQKEQG